MTRDHDEFARLVKLAHDRTHGVIAPEASALLLYRDARDRAKQCLPGPLGEAVAGVLAEEAYQRRASSIGGSLGASKVTMALALAVLDLDSPASDDGR